MKVLSFDLETLKDYFSTFGSVTYFKLGRNKKNQEPLGFAFIEFKDEATTKRVLEQKHHLNGREVILLLQRSMLSSSLSKRKLISSNRKFSRGKCI